MFGTFDSAVGSFAWEAAGSFAVEEYSFADSFVTEAAVPFDCRRSIDVHCEQRLNATTPVERWILAPHFLVHELAELRKPVK